MHLTHLIHHIIHRFRQLILKILHFSRLNTNRYTMKLTNKSANSVENILHRNGR